MPELRWTLLIIGVVFIAALALWERRRPHQAPRHRLREGGESRAEGRDSGWGPEAEHHGPRVVREPTLTLPEIRAREPAAPEILPVVEISDDDSLPLLRQSSRRHEESRLPDRDLEQAPPPILKVAADGPLPSIVEPPPPVDLAEIAAPEEVSADSPEKFAAEEEPSPAPTSPAAPREAAQAAQPREEPIVEWPPEEERRLIALRLVAPPQGRFSGRALRQALTAEGFLLGKFSIFHKPDAQNRAVLSAASLTKPGTFDLETMDAQRFGGLNLFAVLPGPLRPLKAFDELLSVARILNERLEGALQDERGGPLTPMRVAAIRESLEAEVKP